ncbi:MAG TPA: VWA domain-containing protein [Steroidobacteraceae bacterium]|nr:VWA domain-containing protein [Steroidobacteraceae bacterium]
MSLLAPLYLLGLAAIALPLWLHRRRVRETRREPFSSAWLLEPQPQPLRARRRWQHLTLLALRLLLLAALCCAFAQPLWRRHGAPAGTHAALQLIVLDTSMSMGADGRLGRARAVARGLIDRLGAGERAQILSAADGLSVVSGAEPTADATALRAALAGVRVGPGRLDYGAAMAGLDAVLARRRGAVDVHFISDFQASGTPTRFADLMPPASPDRTLSVQLYPVGPLAAGEAGEPNWAISAIRRSGNDIVVSVRGFHTPMRALTVSLEIAGRPAGRLTQTLAADAQAEFRFAQPLLPLGDDRVIARLVAGIDADALPADNIRWAVIHNAPAEPVPLLTDAADERAVSYLSTALAAADSGYVAQVQPLASFDARTLPRYRWLMIDDLGAVGADLAAQLHAYVAGGGAIFAALGAHAAAVDRLPVIGDAVRGSAGANDAPLSVGQLEAGDPVLAGLSGWEALNLSHLLLLAPQPADRVLVAASNGAPLLLERPIGRGRVLLYTSDLDDDGNDLPVQPLFVGLMAQTARYLSGRGELPAAETVGASLALGRAGGPAGQLIDPAGRTVLSLADTSRPLTVKLDQTGFYQIYTAAGEALVAVNPDPLESDLTPMSSAMLARWRRALAALQSGGGGASAGAESAGGAAAARGAAGPAAAASGSVVRVPLAPLLLLLTALLVLAESLLGTYSLRTLRQRSEPQPRGSS